MDFSELAFEASKRTISSFGKESNLPVVVNSEKKVYSRMGNVTSAAAAAQSGKVIKLSEFYSDFV